MSIRTLSFQYTSGIARNVLNLKGINLYSLPNKITFRLVSNPSAFSPSLLNTNIPKSSNFCWKTNSNLNSPSETYFSERHRTSLKESQYFRRSYSKKRKDSQLDSDSSDEELDDVLDKYDKSAKVVKTHLPSLRIDLVIKSALGLPRNKVDVAFYESKIRLNGERVLKKSQRLTVGDEIDLIKSVSPVNEDILTVARIEILSVKPDDEEEIYVRMRRFKSLQIENYENAPYKVEAKEVKS